MVPVQLIIYILTTIGGNYFRTTDCFKWKTVIDKNDLILIFNDLQQWLYPKTLLTRDLSLN